jgi:hypothetical protein
MSILGIDHVQLAAPPGCEAEAQRFYTADPWGNRIELIATANRATEPED